MLTCLNNLATNDKIFVFLPQSSQNCSLPSFSVPRSRFKAQRNLRSFRPIALCLIQSKFKRPFNKRVDSIDRRIVNLGLAK